MPLTQVSPGLLDTQANAQGFRNRIINGDCRVDQRNNGASVTSGFPVDRWQLGLSQSSKLTAQRNAGSVTPPAGFTNYLGITSSSAYSVTSTDYFFVYQAIEGFNAADFAWGSANAASVTLSFRVYSSLTGTFGGAIKNGSANRSYPFSYAISSANTWTTISVTIPGDTSGTWPTDNSAWGYVIFGLGSGSTRLGPAGAWAGANYDAPTGSVSVVGTNGATFYITGVQLEKGTAATDFERLDYGRQLIQCQRYFEVSEIDKASVVGCYTLIAYATTETNGIRFAVTKRANPTVTLFNTSGVSGVIGGNNNAATAGYIGTNGFGYVARTGNTVGAGYYAHFSASSEL